MEVKTIKEVEKDYKNYRLVKVANAKCIDTKDGYKDIVETIKYVIQIRIYFIWIDIKEFIVTDSEEFMEREAIECFDTFVNPYRYG